MAYSLVSATDVRDLLGEIVTFAQAQGWTVEYDNSSTGTGNGGQIALTSGVCHIAIGEASAVINPVSVTGGSDGRMSMALSSSINTGISQFWGHPGSIVTTNTDTNRTTVNDLLGPFTEVHFFGNDEYVMCAVKSTGSRWTHFGFGLLESVGLTGPRVAFCIGTLQQWWSTSVPGGDVVPRMASMDEASNLYWPTFDTLNFTGHNTSSSGGFYIPDGVVDPALGFDNGDIVPPITDFYRMTYFNDSQAPDPHPTNSFSTYLDFATAGQVNNKPTTGGTPMWTAPVFYHPAAIGLTCFIGLIPGVRIANILDVAASAEKVYGAETWKFFPWKAKGLYTEYLNGQANSYDNGFAYFKE